MAAITVQLTNTCSGGNHFRFSVTGDTTATIAMRRDELIEPITAADAESFLRVLTKMARLGRTNNQAKTLLEAGITVTV